MLLNFRHLYNPWLERSADSVWCWWKRNSYKQRAALPRRSCDALLSHDVWSSYSDRVRKTRRIPSSLLLFLIKLLFSTRLKSTFWPHSFLFRSFRPLNMKHYWDDGFLFGFFSWQKFITILWLWKTDLFFQVFILRPWITEKYHKTPIPSIFLRPARKQRDKIGNWNKIE